MKILHIVSTFLMVLPLIATTPVWAGGVNGNNGVGNQCQGNSCGGLIKAPEIDAASGTIPLALLTGVILLMKERSRSKRKND